MLLTIVKQSILYLVKNINFYFLVLFVYSFCVDVRVNLFICSFIRTNIIFANFATFIFFFILTFFVLFILVYWFKYTCSLVNSDWLVFMYRFYYLYNISFLSLFSYIFDVVFFYFIFLYRLYKNSIFYLFFYNLFLNFFSTNLWYPIFKRHSYFGYFRSMRQKWGEIKTEEVNRLKY